MTRIGISTVQVHPNKWLALALEQKGDKLVACTSSQNSAHDAENSLKGTLRRLKRLKELDESFKSSRMDEIGNRLGKLSNGKGHPFSLEEISQKNWSPVRLSISKQLLQVKKGNVISYGGLAKLCQSSPRGVGSVMRSNPVPWAIPCHRVIHSNGTLGKLGGTTSGTKEKARILQAEGVPFKSNGTVQRTAIQK
ncbi:MAG: MGMT family protein [Promethearchaeota archaeon]